MQNIRPVAVALVSFVFLAFAASAATYSELTSNARRIDGYVPLHWNESSGRLYMELSRLGEEMIWQVTLASGVGSNPIGLDRGQLGRTRLVTFRRVGPKVLLVQRNPRFDADSTSESERRAVAESFASSVVWGFEVKAEEAGRVLVDATDFFLSDAHGVARTLRRAEQGSYAVDATRSTIWPEGTKGFPRNTEVEVLLTLTTGDEPGRHVSSVAPTPESVTVRQRHSFVHLPPEGFETRRFDPRVGVFSLEIYDYASPIDSPIETRLAERHRIAKKDPSAAASEPVEPIVYYVDPGAPAPIREALIEGASWWNQAFEAAGFIDGFQVRELPEGADPMDVRYNVIHWTHRSTRGWSYGGSVVDPRTGEILKGNVNLGSLRVRQDVLLAHGLVPHFGGPDGAELASLGDPTVGERMALARIRQLSAHEVGHAIGFGHNFAASTYGRGSVMDYPAPMVEIRDGELDLGNAYAEGIGVFDRFAAKWLYTDFAPGADVDAELGKIVERGVAEGMLYVADDHARPVGAPHPLGSLWDNGADPVEYLEHEIEVRRIALSKFGLATVANGMPLSTLEERLMPLYLHHRYQLESAVKSLGGVSFTYSVRTNGHALPVNVRTIVDPAKQRRALELALRTLEPVFLTVPESMLALIPPVEPEWADGTGERFPRRTGATFDPIAAATTAADITLRALLDPGRASRLVIHHAETAANPSLGEVTGALSSMAVAEADDTMDGAIRRAVRHAIVRHLIALASDQNVDPQAAAVAAGALERIGAGLSGKVACAAEADHRAFVRGEIRRYVERSGEVQKGVRPLPEPAGPPIGARASDSHLRVY